MINDPIQKQADANELHRRKMADGIGQAMSEGADRDGCDKPAGTDPLIRTERGATWFRRGGTWYRVGALPDDVRGEYLREQIRRERLANQEAAR